MHAVRDDRLMMARLLLKAGANRKVRENVCATTCQVLPTPRGMCPGTPAVG